MSDEQERALAAEAEAEEHIRQFHGAAAKARVEKMETKGDEVKCPKCNVELSAAAVVPAEQQVTLVLSCKDGVLSADTIGSSIVEIASLLRAAAKPVPVEVLVFEISQHNNELSIKFVVLPRGKKDLAALDEEGK